MDKFRVGQRVILKPTDLYEYVSCKDVVVPGGAFGTIQTRKDWQGDYEVLFDMYPCPTENDPAWFVKEEDLEPVYDGDEKSSWEECVWKPKEIVNGT